MRLRTCATVLCLILAFGIVPHSPAAYASPPKLGNYYLALGDSYAAGYLAPGLPMDSQCQSSTAPGFVCVFYRYLKTINPQLQLDNLGDPGADSCELAGAGHHCFDTAPKASPVDAGITLINDHPGQVSPITLTIGGNDLLPLLPAALVDPSGTAQKLPGIFERLQTNLDTILSRLRTAAGPDAEIIVTTQPNPLGGIGSPPLPVGLPDLAKSAIDHLNGVIKTEAAKYNTIVADSAAAFDAHPGGAATLTFVPISLASGNPANINIHPTPDGYKVYGDTLIRASGYVLPLTLTVHLGSTQVKRGKKLKVSGTTSAGAAVTVKLWNLGSKAHTFGLTAGSDGAFSHSFKAGANAGKGAVKVCAQDAAGQSRCTAKMKFQVR
jgi:lysophospholipase L1-like esterase